MHDDLLHSFKNLPLDAENQLRGLLHLQSFSAGEMIFLQGSEPTAVYLVANGRVKVVRVTPEGYESILCVRGQGDYLCPVPLLDNRTHLGSAVTMSDVVLFSIDQKDFVHLCQTSPDFLATVQGDCLSEVRRLLNRLEGFAFRGVKQRLAIALTDECRRQRYNESNPNELLLTQQELAGLIGASRESVSRNMVKMEKDGIVQLGRGRVTITDWERLTHLTGENPTD
jgi:CRP-like cAMP-binding protein